MQQERQPNLPQGPTPGSSDDYSSLLAQLDTQRERLNSIVASVPGIVWEAWGAPDAASQRIDYVSEYAPKMLGYSVQEWLATPNFWLTIVHPDDREQAARSAAAAFATGIGGVLEFRWVAKDGRVLAVEAHTAVMFDADGNPAGMRGVTLDITARKRAEQERATLLDAERAARAEADRARQRLAFLSEASALLAASLDYETTLSSIAQLAVPFLADWCAIDINDSNDLPRRLVVVHHDPARAAQAQALWERYPPQENAPTGTSGVLQSGQPEVYIDVPESLLATVAQDAEHLAMLQSVGLKSVVTVPLAAHERVFGTMSFVYAESGRRYSASDVELAKELARRAALAVDHARAHREAQRAVSARDQFISIASHELKTPLTSLLGYAELLQRRAAREGSANERDMRAVGIIYDQAQRLNRLIGSLLDLSRLQSGQLKVERGPVDLCALVRWLASELEPILEHHTLDVQVVNEPLIVSGDTQRLEQVVQNLLNNAVKYSPAGGPVVVRLEQHQASARLSVADRGIGVPRSALPRLFGRFYRAPNVESYQIGGMGLGLYVLREIVQLHGGTVDVRSEEGQGSTFTVELPLEQAERPPAPRPRPEPS